MPSASHIPLRSAVGGKTRPPTAFHKTRRVSTFPNPARLRLMSVFMSSRGRSPSWSLAVCRLGDRTPASLLRLVSGVFCVEVESGTLYILVMCSITHQAGGEESWLSCSRFTQLERGLLESAITVVTRISSSPNLGWPDVATRSRRRGGNLGGVVTWT